MTDLILMTAGGLYAVGAIFIVGTVLQLKSPSDVAWLKVALWPVLLVAAIIEHMKEDSE